MFDVFFLFFNSNLVAQKVQIEVFVFSHFYHWGYDVPLSLTFLCNAASHSKERQNCKTEMFTLQVVYQFCCQ